MKRIITLLLAAFILVVAFPVSAEGITVNIVSVKTGDTFPLGTPVPLRVETNESFLDRIDFYANGVKIPGTVTNAEKPILWTPTAAGTYTLAAKVFSLADTVIGSDSQPVTVTVEDTSIRFIEKAETAADLSNVHNNWLDEVAAATSTDYTKYGKVSAKIGPLGTGAKQYFYIRDINAELGSAENKAYTHINYSVYATKPVTIISKIANAAGTARPQNNSGCWISLQEGWNLISYAIDSTEQDGYWGKTLSDLNEISFYACYGYTIPEGFVNAGTKIVEQPDLASTYLYFDAVWLSKQAVANPVVTKTSIPNGQKNVCNGLGRYTITFDQPMNVDTLTKDNVTLTEAGGSKVTIAGVRTTANTMDLYFPSNSFMYDGEYTLSLSDKIENVFGLSIGENVAFTFKTVSSCVKAVPIPTMSYPQNGGVLASDNAVLATRVIFDGNVNKVEFYEESGDSDVLLSGTAREGSDNEYFLNVADFSAGKHTVYALVTYNNSASTIMTAPVTFTVAEAAEYALTGIDADGKIAVNAGGEIISSKTIGLNTTQNVAKVTFNYDGIEKAVLKAEPFVWKMPITDVKEHSLVVTVYDIFGGVHTLSSTVSADFLVARSLFLETYDKSSSELYNQTAQKGIMTFTSDPATTNKRNGKVAKIDYTGTYQPSHDDSCFVKGFDIPASKQVRIDLDMFVIDNANQTIWMQMRPATYSYSGVEVYRVSSQSSNYNKGAWNKISVLVDFSQADKTTYKTYVNNVFVKSDTVSGTQFPITNKFVIHLMSRSNYYIDNLAVYDYAYASNTEAALDGVTITDAGDSWNADFSLVNFDSEDVDCVVFYATYDSNQKMISVTSDPVTLGAGAVVKKSYTVPKTYESETAAEVRGFVWKPELAGPLDSLK